MLAYEDESARHLFAVYVRPEGERGTINFYADEAAAAAEVGPGMPAGFITLSFSRRLKSSSLSGRSKT